MKRDVDRLMRVAAEVEADAPFRFKNAGSATTLRRQVEQAARNLRATCSAEEAARLEDVHL